MQDKPIPIVIVARNGLALTKQAVNSALAQDVPVEVLVVNNHSQDSTTQWLAVKPVSTIHTMEQWALAKCWNVALAALWKLGFDRAIVLNNDVVLRPDTARLLDAHGGPFVTCVSVGTEDQMGEPGDRNIEDLRETQRNHPDYSCWLIRKSVTDRNIRFNEECWPAYLEDCFHHKAMHNAGIPAVCISLPFLHYSASTLKAADPSEQARIRRGADANRKRFQAKYGCVPGTKEYEALFADSVARV